VQHSLSAWVLGPQEQQQQQDQQQQQPAASEDARAHFQRFAAHLALLLRALQLVPDPRLLEHDQQQHYQLSCQQEALSRIVYT
jgi:hypothetical protein